MACIGVTCPIIAGTAEQLDACVGLSFIIPIATFLIEKLVARGAPSVRSRVVRIVGCPKAVCPAFGKTLHDMLANVRCLLATVFRTFDVFVDEVGHSEGHPSSSELAEGVILSGDSYQRRSFIAHSPLRRCAAEHRTPSFSKEQHRWMDLSIPLASPAGQHANSLPTASSPMHRKTAALRATTTLALLFGLSHIAQANERMKTMPASIETFTTVDQPIRAIETVVAEHPGIAIHVHKLDAIRGLEEKLSQDLPADPDQAKHLALMRLQQMSKGARSQLQHAATSLATAVQYGLEKYPAIVFDGELIVYGLTDLSTALMHYRRWRAGEAL